MIRHMRTWLIASIALAVAPWAKTAEPVRVHVQGGTLVGSADDAVKIFKGIPYAAPPTGPLRGLLPQPAAAWKGERQADDFGFSCMQRSTPHSVPSDSRAARLDEDCLTLNVWAPLAAQNAPVMVYLHGGGNDGGSAAVSYYDGAEFAKDAVVLVSLNYRVGALGFQPHDGAANFGLWDQIAALKWVRENIAVFGGDPGNVTLFGESAGGEDTLILMTAAPARGLFQKAIVESGGGGWQPPPTLAEAQKAQPDGFARPVVDGRLLKEPPLQAFAAGRFVHIPLIIGTNGGEGSLLGSSAHTEGLFTQLSKEDLHELAALYGAEAANDDALARLVFRDGYFASEARWIAAKVSAAGVPAYLYRFAYVLAALRGRRAGAYHGSEIPFVFDRMPLLKIDDADIRVERALHGCWVAFAKMGKPNCDEAPNWPRFEPGREGQWMFIDAHPSARPLEGTAALDLLQCRLAQGVPLISGACPGK